MHKVSAARAIVYVPDGQPIDWNFASQYWEYMQRRGYSFYNVARNLGEALDDLRAGKADLIVSFGPQTHGVRMSRLAIGRGRNEKVTAEGPTRRNVRRIGDEGTTTPLPSAAYVRSVILGDGCPPSGLDPEMIAAARRIARRLGD